MSDLAARQAAEAIRSADALLVGAGAGMGVDSGLPDFRGRDGFWRAYPQYRRLGLDFAAVASPRLFESDPALAWGFYGHRLALYRATRPHDGFATLLSWAARCRLGARVFTSNVDGQFQRSGFDSESVTEIHGTVHEVQCPARCGAPTSSADSLTAEVDERTMRAVGTLPRCRCGAVLRPRVLMFGDRDWDGDTRREREAQLDAFLSRVRSTGARLVVVECGAGTAIPTVRRFCEWTARWCLGTLVRVNPRDFDVPRSRSISIGDGALSGLTRIDAALRPMRDGVDSRLASVTA